MSEQPERTVIVVDEWHAATSSWVRDVVRFPSREAAQAIIADLPKWVGVKVSESHGPEGVMFTLWFWATLAKNGVNGGVNETGLKRLARVGAHPAFEVRDQRTQ